MATPEAHRSAAPPNPAAAGPDAGNRAPLEVVFWGVRGSIASASPRTIRFGGNTTCLEVRAGDTRVILDAGTGIRPLGDRLLAEAAATGRAPEATLLFTHLHWDHIQGFPFFAPAFVPGAHLALYGHAGEGGVFALEAALARQMSPPTFPVTLEAMRATKGFHPLTDGSRFTLGPLSVEAGALPHPNGCLGYRLEAGGRSLCFATDVELPGGDAVPAGLARLARDVDLLILDAQYTPDEYEGRAGVPKRGWGHSTWAAATEVARAVGARRLALFHHDPARDDAGLEGIEIAAQARLPGTFAAREGQQVAV
jgi:phosphoribosyl 1,2-cyclic phosphodiesterase